jgi:hypothetical protein
MLRIPMATTFTRTHGSPSIRGGVPSGSVREALIEEAPFPESLRHLQYFLRASSGGVTWASIPATVHGVGCTSIAPGETLSRATRLRRRVEPVALLTWSGDG